MQVTNLSRGTISSKKTGSSSFTSFLCPCREWKQCGQTPCPFPSILLILSNKQGLLPSLFFLFLCSAKLSLCVLSSDTGAFSCILYFFPLLLSLSTKPKVVVWPLEWQLCMFWSIWVFVHDSNPNWGKKKEVEEEDYVATFIFC